VDLDVKAAISLFAFEPKEFRETPGARRAAIIINAFARKISVVAKVHPDSPLVSVDEGNIHNRMEAFFFVPIFESVLKDFDTAARIGRHVHHSHTWARRLAIHRLEKRSRQENFIAVV
jgi:hypothetical protein